MNTFKNVSMNDAYCVNALNKEIEYLLSINTDTMLAGFRENSGVAGSKIRYGGWENTLIGGHAVGHYFTAVAQAYANKKVSDANKVLFREKIDHILSVLEECQLNSKGESGFLWASTILDKDNVELQFDNVEEGKADIFKEAWVPWYTMHKILDGIVNIYEYTGDTKALEIAGRLGDWVYNRTSKWDVQKQKTVLAIEYGGMNDVLYELYKYTGSDKHLLAAHAFDEIDLFEKVLEGNEDVLDNLHANTTIPKFLGALNRFLALGESEEKYLEYAMAFFEMVLDRHTYITGGNSEWEHFGKDYLLNGERTNCNNETCNTYNMLKMSMRLFEVTGIKMYADYYENTFINAILSSQNPETGMSMYFQPMASGYFKTYGRPFDNFWCCVGTGMENFTKLGTFVYSVIDDVVFTNMYFSSDIALPELGLAIHQSIDFPRSTKANFSIEVYDASLSGAIAFRIPAWAYDYSLIVNGKAYDAEEIGGYLIIERIWNNGDTVELDFERQVVAYNLPDGQFTYAFKYGPVLLSACLGDENMEVTTTGVDVTIPKEAINPYETIKVYEDVEAFMDSISEHLIQKDDIYFELKDTNSDIIYGPHYLKYKERYGIYMNFNI